MSSCASVHDQPFIEQSGHAYCGKAVPTGMSTPNSRSVLYTIHLEHLGDLQPLHWRSTSQTAVQIQPHLHTQSTHRVLTQSIALHDWQTPKHRSHEPLTSACRSTGTTSISTSCSCTPHSKHIITKHTLESARHRVRLLCQSLPSFPLCTTQPTAPSACEGSALQDAIATLLCYCPTLPLLLSHLIYTAADVRLCLHLVVLRHETTGTSNT